MGKLSDSVMCCRGFCRSEAAMQPRVIWSTLSPFLAAISGEAGRHLRSSPGEIPIDGAKANTTDRHAYRQADSQTDGRTDGQKQARMGIVKQPLNLTSLR